MEDGPVEPAWNYDRAEIRADGIVHVAGVSLAVVGALAVVCVALVKAGEATVFGAVVYGACLVATLTLSAVYNMWPVGPAKWLLRRFDHAGIFLLIAGTYTPFALKMGAEGRAFLPWIWALSALGIALKLVFAGRFDRLSAMLYLALGWSGVFLAGAMVRFLSPFTLALILAGGLAYSVGVVFHLWHRLRFQNAIWHAHVLLGAATHYGAVMICVLAAARS